MQSSGRCVYIVLFTSAKYLCSKDIPISYNLEQLCAWSEVNPRYVICIRMHMSRYRRIHCWERFNGTKCEQDEDWPNIS